MTPTWSKRVAIVVALVLISFLFACGDVGRSTSDQVTSVESQVVAASSQALPMSRASYNADGFADIVWQNAASGDIVLWSMNGSTVAADPLIGTVADTEWKVVGRGDFNGDGKTDLLWRNTLTGVVATGMGKWSTDPNCTGIYSGGLLCTPPLDYGVGPVPSGLVTFAREVDLDWMVSGVGDFNNDGKADIVWRNVSTGDVRVWLMNGRTITAKTIVQRVADPIWRMTCVGDFNGDGKSDILWRNVSTGDNAIWLMNGAAVSGSPVFIDQIFARSAAVARSNP